MTVSLSRRRFLRAAVAAPFVITTPGLLMPVRDLWKPPALLIGRFIGLPQDQNFAWMLQAMEEMRREADRITGLPAIYFASAEARYPQRPRRATT